MKILVTGGAGYIGSEIAKQLTWLKTISQVIVYDNFATGKHGLLQKGFNHAKLKIVKADILDSRTLAKEISGCSLVFHAAGVGSPINSNDFQIHQMEQVNHWGTAELVNLLETHAPNARLIYLSTTEIENQNNPSSYTSSIFRAEEEIDRLVKKNLASVLRVADVFGYSLNLRINTLLNKMITDGFLLGKVQILGDGNQTVAFISLDDILRAAEKAISNDFPAGTFNIVSHSATLNFVVQELSSYLPQLETIYNAHHFTMDDRNVSNTIPCKIGNLTLGESIEQFLNRLKD